ncbi:MAG: hypothetical protein ACKOUR_08510, partial [Planctomycetota bacterium]
MTRCWYRSIWRQLGKAVVGTLMLTTTTVSLWGDEPTNPNRPNPNGNVGPNVFVPPSVPPFAGPQGPGPQGPNQPGPRNQGPHQPGPQGP